MGTWAAEETHCCLSGFEGLCKTDGATACRMLVVIVESWNMSGSQDLRKLYCQTSDSQAYIDMTSDVASLVCEGKRRLSSTAGTPYGWRACRGFCNAFSLYVPLVLRGLFRFCGIRDGLVENMPLSPVSVVILSMPWDAFGRFVEDRFSPGVLTEVPFHMESLSLAAQGRGV